MLSFMKEQNQMDTQKQNASANFPAADNNTSADHQEMEYLTVSTRGRDLRKSTITLLVLFVIGLVCLWFMIKRSTPQSASAADTSTEQSQIEATITRLTGIKSEMYDRMDEIVSKFYEFSDVLQVQVNELLKNPFQLEAYLASLNAEPVVDEPTFELDPETLRREQIKQRAKDMLLTSIMQSDRGMCCMIDNKILYSGDSIKDFKVSEIGSNCVKLQSEGVEVVLKLSQ